MLILAAILFLGSGGYWEDTPYADREYHCAAPIYIEYWQDTPDMRLYMYSVAGPGSCFAERWSNSSGLLVPEPDLVSW